MSISKRRFSSNSQQAEPPLIDEPFTKMNEACEGRREVALTSRSISVYIAYFISSKLPLLMLLLQIPVALAFLLLPSLTSDYACCCSSASYAVESKQQENKQTIWVISQSNIPLGPAASYTRRYSSGVAPCSAPLRFLIPQIKARAFTKSRLSLILLSRRA